jgi:drug/metabolite transporter (DMT)-like permease
MNTNTVSLTRPFDLAGVSVILLPILFILMWSSGYVAGKLALPYVGPFMLIFIRFVSAATVLLIVAMLMKAPWPGSWREALHIGVVGLLIQATQFGGLYYALNHGVSAGISALIIGTMPIFTALGATYFLGESVNLRRWLGLLIGLVGVAMVVSNKILIADITLAGAIAISLALMGITAGTLYQKKYCSKMDLRTGGVIQLGIASLCMLFMAWNFEGLRVEWTTTLVLSSAWLSLVNSIGAISVLYYLISRGEASRVASLFYLIPSVTALMAYPVLGETLTGLAIVGFGVTAAGVYITNRR